MRRSLARIERRLASLGWAVKTSSIAKAVEDFLHALGRQAAALQFADPGGHRFRDRLRIALSLALAKHPHPLPVFGDVGQIEKDAERPSHRAGLVVVEPGDLSSQVALGGGAAGPPLPGQQPNALHQIESGGAVEPGDDRAQQVA